MAGHISFGEIGFLYTEPTVQSNPLPVTIRTHKDITCFKM